MAPSVEVGYSAPSVTLDARGLPILEKDMKAKPIDVELMRSLLEYRPDVGGSCLVWKTYVGQRVKVGRRAGNLSKMGYWYIMVKGTQYMAHRLVWAVVMGEDPPCQVDHVLGHEVGNHIENLRLAPNNDADNNQNRRGSRNNTSGYMGVTFHKATNKYAGQISSDGKRYYLGLFDTPEEAYAAYLKAKAELHTFQPIPRGE